MTTISARLEYQNGFGMKAGRCCCISHPSLFVTRELAAQKLAASLLVEPKV